MACAGRAAGAHARTLAERLFGDSPNLNWPWAQAVSPTALLWVYIGVFLPVICRKLRQSEGLCTTQNGEAVPHPPMVCFLSGGVGPPETLNDRCYLICCCSCWKIVWKALTTDGELEFQLTPAADRSFQAGNILIISPLRKFCAKFSLQIIKHPGSGWKGNCLQRHPPMADAWDQKQVCKDWRGAFLKQAHLSSALRDSAAARLGSSCSNHN